MKRELALSVYQFTGNAERLRCRSEKPIDGDSKIDGWSQFTEPRLFVAVGARPLDHSKDLAVKEPRPPV
jgi:hypothetical protein